MRAILKLFPQISDVYFHDIFISDEIVSPYSIQNGRFAHDTIVIQNEKLKQFIFGARKLKQDLLIARNWLFYCRLLHQRCGERDEQIGLLRRDRFSALRFRLVYESSQLPFLRLRVSPDSGSLGGIQLFYQRSGDVPVPTFLEPHSGQTSKAIVVNGDDDRNRGVRRMTRLIGGGRAKRVLAETPFISRHFDQFTSRRCNPRVPRLLHRSRSRRAGLP